MRHWHLWGVLAVHYMHHSKFDSAKWAFKQGEKRGGYSDFILARARLLLDACDKNGLLLSAGDNNGYSVWYVQVMENYRTENQY